MMYYLGGAEVGISSRSALASDLWYLGSPYSCPNAEVIDARFRAAARVAGRLRTDYGVTVFSPIAHTHPISDEIADLVDPCDFDFWLKWDEVFIPKCAGFLITSLPGWFHSKGIKREREWFKEANKPEHNLEVRNLFTSVEWAKLEDWK